MNHTTTNQLVRMSGQFWKLSIHDEQIEMISTIKGYRSTMTFEQFVKWFATGKIIACGEQPMNHVHNESDAFKLLSLGVK